LKAALVPEHALAGVSVYALGFENPAYWQAIKRGFKQP
jgi:spore germination protein YaaH